jgi:hypothetical protein
MAFQRLNSISSFIINPPPPTSVKIYTLKITSGSFVNNVLQVGTSVSTIPITQPYRIQYAVSGTTWNSGLYDMSSNATSSIFTMEAIFNQENDGNWPFITPNTFTNTELYISFPTNVYLSLKKIAIRMQNLVGSTIRIFAYDENTSSYILKNSILIDSSNPKEYTITAWTDKYNKLKIVIPSINSHIQTIDFIGDWYLQS